MNETKYTPLFELENRTFRFSKDIIRFVKKLPKDYISVDMGRQLARSASSVGANYIEANESLGKKDFLMRLRISKKEAKESAYWLQLLEPESIDRDLRDNLVNESIELMKILGSIIEKSK